jgi:hypothetical protein
MAIIRDHDGQVSSSKLYRFIVFLVSLALIIVSLFINVKIGTWGFTALIFFAVFLDRANARKFAFEFAGMKYRQENTDVSTDDSTETVEEGEDNDGN